MDRPPPPLWRDLAALAGALWRHPNSKPLLLAGLSMVAFYHQSYGTGFVLIWLAYMWWLLFGEA